MLDNLRVLINSIISAVSTLSLGAAKVKALIALVICNYLSGMPKADFESLEFFNSDLAVKVGISYTDYNFDTSVLSGLYNLCQAYLDGYSKDSLKGFDIGQLIHNSVHTSVDENLGQVFTPVELGEFIAKLLSVDSETVVYDGAAGSGALLLSSLSQKPKKVVAREYDKYTLVLLGLNAFIHSDVEWDFAQGDSTKAYGDLPFGDSPVVAIMNPPYETEYGCMEIIESSLDSLPLGSLAAFIIPVTKVGLPGNTLSRILAKHTCVGTVLLSDNIFRMSMTTPIGVYIFMSGVSHDSKEYFKYDLSDVFFSFSGGVLSPCDSWESLTTKAYDSIITRDISDPRYLYLSYKPFLANLRYAEDAGDVLEYFSKEAEEYVKSSFDVCCKLHGTSVNGLDLSVDSPLIPVTLKVLMSKRSTDTKVELQKEVVASSGNVGIPIISGCIPNNGCIGLGNMAPDVTEPCILLCRINQSDVKVWAGPISVSNMLTIFTFKNKPKEEFKLLLYVACLLRQYLVDKKLPGFSMVPYSYIENLVLKVPQGWL